MGKGLPRAYAKDVHQTNRAAVFGHVYESRFGDAGRVVLDTAYWYK